MMDLNQVINNAKLQQAPKKQMAFSAPAMLVDGFRDHCKELGVSSSDVLAGLVDQFMKSQTRSGSEPTL